MKIFADLHHAGLYYSLHLLFEKRLGMELYRPIGIDWFTQGFWDVAKPYGNNAGTVEQFLSLGSYPVDETPPLNTVTGVAKFGYRVLDEFHSYEQKAILFEQFKNTKFDLIIASIPDHWMTYEKLRREYQPQAKLICQMGNIGWEQQDIIKQGYVKNLLASTKPFNLPSTTHSLFYYQEMPVEDYTPPPSSLQSSVPQSINSFVHLLPNRGQYLDYKSRLKDDFMMKSYGIDCPDGWSPTLRELYRTVRNSNYVYQVKPGGDGFGWNWHTAFMMGRPILTNFSDYRDKLGGVLFEDMVTGLDLEKRTVEENCKILREGMDGFGEKLAENAKKRWAETVNYEVQAENVKQFLSGLL